jgi:hypothetical protein
VKRAVKMRDDRAVHMAYMYAPGMQISIEKKETE